MSSASEIRFGIKPPSRLLTPLGKDLFRRRPEIVADTTGITFPLGALAHHAWDSEAPTEKRVRWIDLTRLRVERDHYGKFDYVFVAGNDEILVGEDELNDPAAFQATVERLSGRLFEKAFSKAPPVSDESPGPSVSPEAPTSIVPTDATKFRVLPPDPPLTVLRSYLGCIARVAAVVALFVGVSLLFPDQMMRFLDSPIGWIGMMVALLAVIALPRIVGRRKKDYFTAVVKAGLRGDGWAVFRPKTQEYFIAVAREGLYAQVPSRTFPRFTSWNSIRDFTFQEPEHRFTLYTSDGTYALDFVIPEHFDLVRAIMSRIQREA